MVRILWIIAAIIIAFWVVGLVTNLFGGLVHLLLIGVVAIVIFNLITGKRSTT